MFLPFSSRRFPLQNTHILTIKQHTHTHNSLSFFIPSFLLHTFTTGKPRSTTCHWSTAALSCRLPLWSLSLGRHKLARARWFGEWVSEWLSECLGSLTFVALIQNVILGCGFGFVLQRVYALMQRMLFFGFCIRHISYAIFLGVILFLCQVPIAFCDAEYETQIVYFNGWVNIFGFLDQMFMY